MKKGVRAESQRQMYGAKTDCFAYDSSPNGPGCNASRPRAQDCEKYADFRPLLQGRGLCFGITSGRLVNGNPNIIAAKSRNFNNLDRRACPRIHRKRTKFSSTAVVDPPLSSIDVSLEVSFEVSDGVVSSVLLVDESSVMVVEEDELIEVSDDVVASSVLLDELSVVAEEEEFIVVDEPVEFDPVVEPVL